MQEGGEWEHFPHGSDIGVRGYGHRLEEAFQMAATALTAIVADPQRVQPLKKVVISCDAFDIEVLLNDWLNALIFEMDTRRMLFSKFSVDIQEGHLTATAWGEEVDVQRHHPVVDLKGATFTELKVEEHQGCWLAQCVIDV